MSFKEEFITMLNNELERPRREYKTIEEKEAFKDGITKALNIFKSLSYSKEILAIDPFCEISRVDSSEL